MTTPGVEPGLSRPQRDILTTRRCGLLKCLRVQAASTSPVDVGWPIGRSVETCVCACKMCAGRTSTVLTHTQMHSKAWHDRTRSRTWVVAATTRRPNH